MTDDFARLGFEADEWVDPVSVDDKGAARKAPGFRRVAFDMPAGNVEAYFPGTNVLVPLDCIDKRSGTPASKSIPVHIHRTAST